MERTLLLALAAWITSCHVSTTAWTTTTISLTTTTTTSTPLLQPSQLQRRRRRRRRLLTVVRGHSSSSSRATATTTVSESSSATPLNHLTRIVVNTEDDDDDDDDTSARSMFGTKAYWDDVYKGMGDFPADMYSWYYDLGHAILGRTVKTYLQKDCHILLPGIGNDPLLMDLLKAGYRHLTAQDYSAAAIERQYDLLALEGLLPPSPSPSPSPTTTTTSSSSSLSSNKNKDYTLQLTTGNVRQLPADWTCKFDAILEKGLLDAVYLSGDGHVEEAVQELTRVLKRDGILMSVSGVVPPEIRKALFFDNKSCWECLRDGSDDLEAGCFVWRKMS